MLRARCEDCGAVLGDRIIRAGDFRRRLAGLLFRRGLAPGDGLLLEPCNAVHTFFMRFPIDVVFLAGDNRVLRVAQAMGPWRAAACRGAVRVLELAAGTVERCGMVPGARLVFEEL